jgi:hypothetical protein
MTFQPDYGRPVFLGTRRSRKKHLAEARNRHVERQADVFVKRSQLEEFFSRFENNPNIPQELIGMMKMQMDAMMPPDIPDIPADEELQRVQLEGFAEEFAGAHFEMDGKGGYTLRNFRAILFSATEVKMSKGIFEISTPEGDYEFAGETAIAFERFLYFTGLMTLENNKAKCPECGHKKPQDCPECGGLGWVLKTAPETYPAGALPRPEREQAVFEIPSPSPGPQFEIPVPRLAEPRLAKNEADQCTQVLGVHGRCILNRGHQGDHQELRNQFEDQV